MRTYAVGGTLRGAGREEVRRSEEEGRLWWMDPGRESGAEGGGYVAGPAIRSKAAEIDLGL